MLNLRGEEISSEKELILLRADLEKLFTIPAYLVPGRSTSDDTSSQAMCGSGSHPPDKPADDANKRYEFTAARRYALEVGAGPPVLAPSVKQTRERVDPTKLENFLDFITSSNIVQDLPFGWRTLTLSSCEKIDIISLMSYESNDAAFPYISSDNTTSTAAKKTSFHFLPAPSFVSCLRLAWPQLMQYGANDPEIHKLKDSLKHLKQYTKSDYKIHCSIVSSVPDHCRVFALSRPKKKCFHRRCDLHHNQQCESCEILKTSLDLVKSFMQSTNLPEDVQDDALFTARTARDAVLSHQLRMVHQDVARSDVIDSLGEDSTLITQDFAMKFLPAEYREPQAEFFGKRGISWHPKWTKHPRLAKATKAVRWSRKRSFT
ncbi:Hypothetical predicted protein [Paramuricea clavata]|uniref:Uncharacterized protein n=1 Tax=Paramuricea clavata TaxID=317549 RepID=A0A7D9HMI8_PARCT|nr:Hypothetical predicted protein [Paramuricea clavata]